MHQIFDSISFIHLPHKSKGGLPIIDNRNFFILNSIFPNVTKEEYNPFLLSKKHSFIKRLFFKISLFLGINIIHNNLIEDTQLYNSLKNKYVFFSHSFFGFIIQLIKKRNPEIKIISFFHNVEIDYQKQILQNKTSIYNIYRYFIVKNSEKRTVKYSDIIFVLNNRDASLIYKTYGRNDMVLLPTSLLDRFKPNLKKKINNNHVLKLLFIGTYFPSNEEGVLWFINNIIPNINVKFQIVGMGMDNLKNKYSFQSNIEITGEVDSKTLDSYLYNADLFVSTLFSGGGMKTKIAEAMMFGLPIIGTTETFQGYEFDHSLIGINSENPQNIISFINAIDKDRSILSVLSENSRRIYTENYSINSSINTLKNIVKTLESNSIKK